MIEKERFKGRINFSIRYGHPDGEYSRLMTRKLGFDQMIKPNLPPGLPGILIPMGGPIPLVLGSHEQDRDEPYSEDLLEIIRTHGR